jgi:hypothetical protein
MVFAMSDDYVRIVVVIIVVLLCWVMLIVIEKISLVKNEEKICNACARM